MNKIDIEKLKTFLLEKPDKLEKQNKVNVTRKPYDRTGKCVVRACNMRFLKIIFDSAEIFNF